MGKKSVKGKEKKLKLKEEQKKIAEALVRVKLANEVDDHLKELSAFSIFKKNGLDINITCVKCPSATSDDLQYGFDITKRNMKKMYEACSWGWDDKSKREEMTDDRAWYLFAKDQTNTNVAAVHFRFDLDNDDDVLYCYEIQLEESVQGKGLGKTLMKIIEIIGLRANMRKVMLTVFKDNNGAKSFFTKLRYITDETSPEYFDPSRPELYDYEILSKQLVKVQQSQ